MSKCHQCHRAEATIQISSHEEATELSLCSNCHNEILAKKLGIRLKEIPASLSMPDKEGELRHFNVEMILHPMGIRMEAAEDNRYGYKFEVYDELDRDQVLLFNRLVKKVKRGLETTYLKEDRFPNGEYYQSMKENLIVGRIESSDNNWDIPTLVIDGKPYTWDEVGKILMSNEGFQLQMKVFDITDDIE